MKWYRTERWNRNSVHEKWHINSEDKMRKNLRICQQNSGAGKPKKGEILLKQNKMFMVLEGILMTGLWHKHTVWYD